MNRHYHNVASLCNHFFISHPAALFTNELMYDFFTDHKQTAARVLNMLSIKDNRDIHLATLQILEKTGVFVENQQALEFFGSCGASVDKKSKIVKLPSGIVEDAICSAPDQVLLAGRIPGFDIFLEDNKSAYVNFGGNINVADPYTGMDLRLGTSPLGSPETAMIAVSVAALCRYYQLPCLVPGISSDSKQPGAQPVFI